MLTSTLPRYLAAALLLSGTATAHAATLQVTTTADDYDGLCDLHCSLRDAVTAANQAPSADTILLVAGTHVLNRPLALDANGLPIEDNDIQTGDLDVSGKLHIKGLDTTKSIIRNQANDRLFEVRADARLTLEGLSLEKGVSYHNGGAVKNLGQLTLRDVLAQLNRTLYPMTAPPFAPFQRGQGGVIANYGKLTVLASRIQDNVAEGRDANDNAGHGGAVFNGSGRVLLRDSVFLYNRVEAGGHGAAVYNLKGQVTVERSSFLIHGIRTPSSSGTIFNDEGEVTLTNSTLSQNHIGALTNIRREPGARAKATLTHVTITGSFMDGNHAVMNSGDLVIHNSIIAGNSDPFVKLGPANCINLGEHYSYQATGLLLGNEPSNCSGDYFASSRDTYFVVLTGLLSKPDQLHWFHALRPGSPAVDAGVGDCIAHDQAGAPRPQDGNGDGVAACDLGAHELTP